MAVKYTDEAPEKTKEECCPGAPYISFSTQPGIFVNISNPEPCNGLFTTSVKIVDGDSVANVISKIAKGNKRIEGKYLGNRNYLFIYYTNTTYLYLN